MKILILENSKEVSKKVAQFLYKQIILKPNSNLGLATGQTMIPIYEELSRIIKLDKTDLSRIKTFNIDEYHTLLPNNKNSYHYYMNDLFFKNTNIKPENIFFPNAIKPSAYDKLIKKNGGIDLMLLGIGANGHIAFNEPGSSIKSNTRIVKLTELTRKSNSVFFKDEKMPTKAISIGISTILKSKKIILIATGKNKSDIISRTLKSKPSPSIPASFLKRHKKILFILDKDAASLVK